MYSVDIDPFSEALNSLKEILEGETEVFMDVQDLVLKWLFERTFSGRPDIIVNLMDFQNTIIVKYASAPLFSDNECEIIVWSVLHVYINIKRYYPVHLITNSVLKAAGQVGQPNMLKSLMKVFDENKVITNYHCEDILDIIYIIIQKYGLCQEYFMKKYIRIWENICYNENNRAAQTSCLRLVKLLFQQNSQLFTTSLQNEEKKEQLVEYIQQLIMNDENEQIDTNQNNDQPFLNTAEINPNSYMPTQNFNVAEMFQAEEQNQPVNFYKLIFRRKIKRKLRTKI